MPTDNRSPTQPGANRSFYYGWVIVAASCLLLVTQAGIQFSFGVFFKPMAASLDSNREAISAIYSVRQVTQGVFSIPLGWLADRFGPAKVMAFCGFMVGLGLVLTSRATSLWQLHIAYGLIVGIGLSGVFIVASATTARWFTKKRGLALGIVSAGMGLGTLIIVPIAERMVVAFDWPKANFLFGVASWIIMITCALLLRLPRAEKGQLPQDTGSSATLTAPGTGVTLKAALRSKPLWMLIVAFFLLSFCVQMVMVHLVNYATDRGISALVAATAVSIVGVGGVAGRLGMGAASDRIGATNAIIICFAIVTATLVWLIFASQLWMLFLFAMVFGFAYGGEVPQIPVVLNRLYGMRAVAALVGAVMFGTTTGGAVGAWLGGKIFDVTSSYQIAFAIAVAASLAGTAITLLLKRQRRMAIADSIPTEAVENAGGDSDATRVRLPS